MIAEDLCVVKTQGLPGDFGGGEETDVGSVVKVRSEVPKDAKLVGDLMKPVVEAFELLFSPMPSVPVGAGA